MRSSFLLRLIHGLRLACCGLCVVVLVSAAFAQPKKPTNPALPASPKPPGSPIPGPPKPAFPGAPMPNKPAGPVNPAIPASPRPPVDLQAARLQINRLANEGNYDEAIKKAKDLIGPVPAFAEQDWLRTLEEEKKKRAEVDRLRTDHRLEEAITAASETLKLKSKRNGYAPDSMEDTRWLTELKNEKTLANSGLSVADQDRILRMEYRDKWFDYQKEIHDGGMLADAIAETTKSLAALKTEKGDDAVETIAAREKVSALTTERAQLVEKLAELMKYRDQEFTKGQFKEAAVTVSTVIDLKRKIYGDDDLTVAISQAELARIYQRSGELYAAEDHFKAARDIFAKLYGPNHWRTKDADVAATEADMIASEFKDTRKHIVDSRFRTFTASRLLEKGHHYEAMRMAEDDEDKIAEFANTKRYSHFATNQVCLAMIYRAMSRFKDAEKRQRLAVELLGDIYGEEHPDYVKALNTLFELNKILGDRSQALATARRSVVLTEKVWGPAHGEKAISLNNLGEAELAVGRIHEARELFIQALQLSEQHFKTYGQAWTTSLQNLAEVHRLWGEYPESARLLRHVAKNRTVEYGPKHAMTLDALYRLGEVETDAKNYAESEKIFPQLIEVSRTVHGPKHIQRALYLSGMARLCRAMGDDAKAEPFLREGLEIARINLDNTFAALSERQQLAMTRDAQRMLFAYVDLAVALRLSGEEAYRHIIGWKGAVLNQQKRLRLGADQPQLAALLKEYQETSRQLATLALAVAEPRQRQVIAAQVAKLSQQKERQEGELASRSQQFRQSKDVLTTEKLKDLLPADSALADFIEYNDSSPSAPRNGTPPERRLAAFVIRPGRDIELVGLGDVAPLRTLGEQWRAEIMRGRGGINRGLKLLPSKETGTKPATTPQFELRQRLWEPLERHLAEAKLLLWSPDGVTAKIPLSALPGKDANRYLIEEMPMVIVPSPSQLVGLPATASTEPGSEKMSLLVIGDVDFGAAAGTSAPEGNPAPLVAQRSAPRLGDTTFSPLPGTGREVKSIASLFREHFAQSEVSELLGADATEGHLRETGPGHRYLHLATHGFFAPEPTSTTVVTPPSRNRLDVPDVGEKVSDLHPGLLSGIAMAGANPGQKASPENQSRGLVDDGILTTLEVASLDLSGVELAILSACETGLGQSEVGEGLLGLQRGFQVAGARSTVASLWKVDDSATQQLMVEFYRNLWEKKLGKLESLRQAQLTMLHQYDSRQQKLVPRGLKVVGAETSSSEPTLLAPYYWAAFMLSGEWR